MSVGGFHFDGAFSKSGAANGTVAMEATDITPTTLDETLGLLNPKFTKYATCESRLQSFRDWPKFLNPSKTDLATAGFVYTGKGDLVYCFCCGIRVKDWEPTDHAFSEHWTHSPNCNFLIMCRNKNTDTLHCRKSLGLFSFTNKTHFGSLSNNEANFENKGLDVVDKLN